jgi:hypothetical protein
LLPKPTSGEPAVLEDIASLSFIKLSKISTSNINTVQLQPSQVFEDNMACIVFSTIESNFKLKTKHISIKWHLFHDRVGNGNLHVIKVPSDSNWADIFTKAKFQKLWVLMIGS